MKHGTSLLNLKKKRMKILVFGAGVIGTTYAWQLSESGYDVSLLVRKHKLVRYSHSGISINCTDMRGKKKEFVKTVFRPKTTDRLNHDHDYDLIIVSVRTTQLEEAIPYVAKFAGQATILFLSNLWDGFDLINKHLTSAQMVYGFPGMAGGGRTDNSINCLLFRNGSTMLGEPDGKTSRRLVDIANIFGRSGLQPKITNNIITWLKAHYVWPAASFGAVCKAGDARSFASNYLLVKQSALAIREGLKVCKKERVNPMKIFPYNLFFLPTFIITPLLKRSYSEEMAEVMDGHIKHGFDEMKKQYYDIVRAGKKHGVRMPYLVSFEKYILEAEKKQRIS